jgi:hypothetical protein
MVANDANNVDPKATKQIKPSRRDPDRHLPIRALFLADFGDGDAEAGTNSGFWK